MVEKVFMLAQLLADVKLSDGVCILFAFLILAVIVGISVFLYFRIKKNKDSVLNKKNEKSLISKQDFVALVDTLAQRPEKSIKYNLYRIDITNYVALKTTLGDELTKELDNKIVSRLLKVEPWGVKVGLRETGSFYVLVHFEESQTPEIVSNIILKVLGQPFNFGEELDIQLVVDVASVSFPKYGKTYEKLEDCLNVAIAIAHRSGINKFAIYNSQLKSETTTEYKFYQEIKKAVKNKEFNMHYQPIIEIDKYDIVGSESFLRWINKEKGTLNPADFLAIMEQTGDIYNVGLWCFDKMLSELINWQQEFNKRFYVSMNLSIVQLQNIQLFDEIRKIVRKHQVEPNQIMFEIDDMGMYDKSTTVKDNINRLSALGINICLDNFGLKFSTATALQDYPLNAIKIAPKFWQMAKSMNVIKNMIKLIVDYGKEKHIMVIANGVENQDDIIELKDIGVNYMQGFAFEKPQELEKFTQNVLIKSWVNTSTTSKKSKSKS